MRRAKGYFFCQIKRILRISPLILTVTALLITAVFLAGRAFLDSQTQDDSRMHLKIGVVGNSDSKYISLGVFALKSLDSGRFAIEFEETDEETARQQLQTKELSAYVVIPENFVHEISRGRIEKISYYTTSTATGVITILKDEIADEVSSLMTESQKGVFGAREAIYDSVEDEDAAGELSNELNIEYIEKIMQRKNLFDIHEVGLSDGLSAAGSFICGIAIFFLMIWGICAIPLFVGREHSLSRVLAAKKFSPLMQILCEYAAYLSLTLATVFLISCALTATGADISALLPESRIKASQWLTVVFFKLIPIATAISALQFFIYEIATGFVGSMLAQFLTAVTLSFISGCIYPIGFMPEIIARIAPFLPSGVARECLSEIILGRKIGKEVFFLFLFTFLFLGASAIIRSRRINKPEAGTL